MSDPSLPGSLLLLLPLIIVIAGLYASVGLGGGTGYIAVMSLFGMSATTMASTALLLNITVTGAALLRYGISRRIPWKILLPFLLPAIPAAFFGGLLVADRMVFLALLAIALTVASLVMFFNVPGEEAYGKKDDYNGRRLLLIGIPGGIIIGLFSGFLGVGGGVFLGPIILMLRLTGPKQMAAMNSIFILVLSSIALMAHGIRGGIAWGVASPLAIAALIGGFAGASLAEKIISPRVLQRAFAVIIFVAAVKAAFDIFS